MPQCLLETIHVEFLTGHFFQFGHQIFYLRGNIFYLGLADIADISMGVYSHERHVEFP